MNQSSNNNLLSNAYEALIFRFPTISLVILAVLLALSVWLAQGFRMDTSADSLVLENDEDLRYYRSIVDKYGSEDFLVIAFKPNDDLLSESTLDAIDSLRNDIQQEIPRIASSLTVVDAALINSPRIGLSDLSKPPRTIRSEQTDKQLARVELQTSPAYGNNLVSADGDVTAILLTCLLYTSPSPRDA